MANKNNIDLMRTYLKGIFNNLINNGTSFRVFILNDKKLQELLPEFKAQVAIPFDISSWALEETTVDENLNLVFAIGEEEVSIIVDFDNIVQLTDSKAKENLYIKMFGMEEEVSIKVAEVHSMKSLMEKNAHLKGKGKK